MPILRRKGAYGQRLGVSTNDRPLPRTLADSGHGMQSHRSHVAWRGRPEIWAKFETIAVPLPECDSRSRSPCLISLSGRLSEFVVEKCSNRGKGASPSTATKLLEEQNSRDPQGFYVEARRTVEWLDVAHRI